MIGVLVRNLEALNKSVARVSFSEQPMILRTCLPPLTADQASLPTPIRASDDSMKVCC